MKSRFSKNSPLVSIVIPCYNAEDYIAEAIESALAQSYPAVEVIVVDDGSTDRSIEIIHAYQEKISLIQQQRQGACIARNAGLKASCGQYVQFLDADDVLLSDKLRIQMPFLISSQCDLVFCNGYLFGDDRPQRPIKKLRALPSPYGIDPFLYCLRNGFGTEGPIHRRSLLERVGGFREGLVGAQEYDLHVRLGAIGARIHKVDDYLFRHRNHDDPNRITRTPKLPNFHVEMLLGLLDRLQIDSVEPLTLERRNAFASFLFQSSIHAYRKGAEETAQKGFAQAQALCLAVDYNERFTYKLLAQLTSPMTAEACFKQARAFRDKFKDISKLSLAGLS